MAAFNPNEKLPVLSAWLVQAETIAKPSLTEFPDQGEQRQLLKLHRDIVFHSEDLATLLQPLAKKPEPTSEGNDGYLISVPLSLAKYFSCRSAKRNDAVVAGGSLPLDVYEIMALRDFYLNVSVISCLAKKYLKKEKISTVAHHISAAWWQINIIFAKAEGNGLLYDENRYIGIPEEVEI